MSAPVASVIVAAYNAEAFLVEAVRSVLAQTLTRLEVIVVDDASSDGTLALARRLAAEDARVRVVAQPENRGPGAARNRGIAEARGEWIAVLDSDDGYEPDRLRRLIVHAANRDADMVADDLTVVGAHGLAREARQLEGQVAAAEQLDLLAYLRRTGRWNRQHDPGFLKPVFRAELLRQLPYVYDEGLRISEDDDLVVRLLLAGACYRLLPYRGYRYRQHEGSITRHQSLDQLKAMVGAAERQLRLVEAQAPRCRRAALRRLHTRQRALAFETVVANLKHHQIGPALARVLRNPGIAPMFAAPLRKRIAMLGQVR